MTMNESLIVNLVDTIIDDKAWINALIKAADRPLDDFYRVSLEPEYVSERVRIRLCGDISLFFPEICVKLAMLHMQACLEQINYNELELTPIELFNLICDRFEGRIGEYA
jgi:hypothetical protein